MAGQVIGVGGVFFKAGDTKAMNSWYAENLGVPKGPGGFSFPWRDSKDPQTERTTVWALFPRASEYFPATFMINYIVDDLDALLAKLAASGASIDPKRDDTPYGRFAWVTDPEGNKIELWEPKKQNP